MRQWITVVTAAAVASCAHVRPEDMSAAEHQAEVERHERAARDAESRYAEEAASLPPIQPPIWRDPSAAASAPATKPGEQSLSLAELNRAHGREHAAAVAKLEEARRAECGDDRDGHSCPLLRGRIARVDLVTHGVRLHAKADVDVEALARQMRCHLAIAHLEGIGEEGSCLLFFRGVHANVTQQGRAIDLHTGDPRIVQKLHAAALRTFRPEAPAPSAR